MNGRNLFLQRGVHQPMPGEHILAFELGGNDNRHERLSAAACHSSASILSRFFPLSPLFYRHTRQIFNLNMLSLQLLNQLAAHQLRRNTGTRVCHGCVDGRGRARGERKERFLNLGVVDGSAEKIAATSAENGSAAGEHQRGL